MSRISIFEYDQMTPEQKALHDEILTGPRSRIGGPMNAWFLSPELGSISQKLGAFCRYATGLKPRLSELAILIVARHWDQNVEWWAHRPLAEKAGLDPSIADAILERRAPNFENTDEELVYSVATELIETRKLARATYDQAVAMFGEKTFLELTAVLGYYTNIAMQMNAFAVTVPEGETPAFGPVDD